jgi:hypothetical protein
MANSSKTYTYLFSEGPINIGNLRLRDFFNCPWGEQDTIKNEYEVVFAPSIFLPHHRRFDCQIDLPDGDIPPRKKLRPLVWEKPYILDKFIGNLLLVGYVEGSFSPFASGIIMKRKPDITYPLCVDYRNKNT